MQCCLAAVGVALCALVAGVDASAMKKNAGASSFGPSNCVSLSRSSAGSCVITTDCENDDTTQTEFAFDCIGKSTVRHSFGVGGFEAAEEFDTDVKCDRCHKASPTRPFDQAAKPVALKALPSFTTEEKKEKPEETKAPKEPAMPAKEEPKVEKVKKEPASTAAAAPKAKVGPATWPWQSDLVQPEAVKYGPHGCVSTYKNKEGHCVIATDCGVNENMKDYEYGLVCVDKVGSPVKHLFGKDSFDSKETFDTLIKCEGCLGLEDIPDAVTLSGEVATMAKDIHSLNGLMVNISKNVQMLNLKVFPVGTAAEAGDAPAGASPAPAAAAEESKAPAAAEESKAPAAAAKKVAKKDAKKKASAFLHHHHHMRHSKKHHKKHHRHQRRQEYDDDEDDEDDEKEDEKKEEKKDEKKDDESDDSDDDGSDEGNFE